MYNSIIILIVLASILMCLIVLIQESKGGGLAADYSNNNQILGAPKTTNFIEKATWFLAGTMIFLSVISVAFLPGLNKSGSVMTNSDTEMSVPATTVPGMDQTAAPAAPAGDAAPAQNP